MVDPLKCTAIAVGTIVDLKEGLFIHLATHEEGNLAKACYVTV